MVKDIRSIDYYKDILRQAIGHTDHFSTKGKQDILTFKDKLQQYIKVVDEAMRRPAEDASEDAWTIGIEVEGSSGTLKQELDQLGQSIMQEVALAKSNGH